MGDPIRQLSPELIREHPALAAFSEYIRRHSGTTPTPEAIHVDNRSTQDGILLMRYEGPNHEAFVARLSAAGTGLLELNRGHLVRGRPVMSEENRETLIPNGVCDTVHLLGGNEEDRFICTDQLTARRLGTYGIFLGSNYLGIGFFSRGRFIRWVNSGISSALRLGPPTAPAAPLELSAGAPLLGAGAMLLSYPLADSLGLHRRFHLHERDALAALSGYGTYRAAAALFGRHLGVSGATPTGMAASLISAGLVDATIGQFFEEGSFGRHAARTAGFFIPQIYRGLAGSRVMALSERRSVGAFSRWGGRAVLAAFAADAGYMLWNHWTNGTEGSARENMIYERGWQLHNHRRGAVESLFYGAAELLAPALAHRFLTPDSDIAQARTDLAHFRTELATGLSSSLRHGLLFHPYGRVSEPSFYSSIDLSWLRGENSLNNAHTADGRELPIRRVYEQLTHSRHFRDEVEPQGEAAVLNYIVENFSGFNLNEGDAREILARIHVYEMRESIIAMHQVSMPSEAPLLALFDTNGSLRAGREDDLIRALFPELDATNSTGQLLALRRTGLVTTIRHLESGLGAGDQLTEARTTARALGLLDTNGAWVEGETTSEGLALYNRIHATTPAPAPGEVESLRILFGAAG